MAMSTGERRRLRGDGIPCYKVNAFTSQPFKGNPAVVCMLCHATGDVTEPGTLLLSGRNAGQITTILQEVASELSTVETVFVFPPTRPKTDFHVRFFSRNKETAFCGHALLAAAHILTTSYGDTRDEFLFTCENGAVANIRRRRRNVSEYVLVLRPSAVVVHDVERPTSKSVPAAVTSAPAAGALLTAPVPLFSVDKLRPYVDALGLETFDVAHVLTHVHSSNIILVLKSVAAVIRAKPNKDQLLALRDDFLKVTITAVPNLRPREGRDKATPIPVGDDDDERLQKYDFVSRLFAPKIGILEDAVSGASHALLARYWTTAARQGAANATLRALQPSPRGGELAIDVRGQTVYVAGEAVTVATGLLGDFWRSRVAKL